MGINTKYKGVIVPMVTPFTGDHAIDEKSTEKLVDHLVSHKVIPFILGTTGESASMSPYQKVRLAETVAMVNGGRSPLMAGISSNSLDESVSIARKFADLGFDVVVATLPSYYPMNEDQMLAYLETLAGSVPKPLLIYNIPATTGLSIPLEVIERLSHHPNIAGMKESERDPARLDRSLQLWSGRDDFSFLLGWAARSVYGLTGGADGIVPSTANLVPDLYSELYRAVEKGQAERAAFLQEQTDQLTMLYQENRKLNESIPALKLLLSLRSLCGTHVLPPLQRMEKKAEERYLQDMLGELEKLTG